MITPLNSAIAFKMGRSQQGISFQIFLAEILIIFFKKWIFGAQIRFLFHLGKYWVGKSEMKPTKIPNFMSHFSSNSSRIIIIFIFGSIIAL